MFDENVFNLQLKNYKMTKVNHQAERLTIITQHEGQNKKRGCSVRRSVRTPLNYMSSSPFNFQ